MKLTAFILLCALVAVFASSSYACEPSPAPTQAEALEWVQRTHPDASEEEQKEHMAAYLKRGQVRSEESLQYCNEWSSSQAKSQEKRGWKNLLGLE